jgi:acyl-CoA dehydrogenase
MSDPPAYLDLDTFCEEANEFLAANAPKRRGDRNSFVWGEGDDIVSIIEERDAEQDEVDLARARDWAARRFDAGFGWIDGPRELGGRGLPAHYRQAYRRLEAGYEIPDQSYFMIGLGMVAPTIAAHATPDIQRRYLAPLYRGDLLACQLFSEPGAGSDLAAVATRAERDGDEWVVNGQKVWTSNAHLADIGELICRTDPDLPKHKGLSAFIVDMRTPGVEVRPLRQMTGGAGFNEVYLSDVRVPDSHRLGDQNHGWDVALTTLLNERAAIGNGMGLGRGPGPFERLIGLMRQFGAIEDPLLRGELARLYTSDRIASWTLQRASQGAAEGQPPGPELSILKLASVERLQRTSDFVGRILGPRLIADTGEWGTFAWSSFVCGVPGGRLGGGTDEVMRNIVGERVLGLAKEPGLDSRTPFRDIPR